MQFVLFFTILVYEQINLLLVCFKLINILVVLVKIILIVKIVIILDRWMSKAIANKINNNVSLTVKVFFLINKKESFITFILYGYRSFEEKENCLKRNWQNYNNTRNNYYQVKHMDYQTLSLSNTRRTLHRLQICLSI